MTNGCEWSKVERRGNDTSYNHSTTVSLCWLLHPDQLPRFAIVVVHCHSSVVVAVVVLGVVGLGLLLLLVVVAV